MTMRDLDDVLNMCRNSSTKRLLSEAVACYHAGAYRASIILSWNALVVDYIHKLNELKSLGDANAASKVADINRIREAGPDGYRKSEDFETNFLSVAANDFELFTPLDLIDLRRLKEDRNRCAHPSMQDDVDPFAPTAELARLHIVNITNISLSREPVQGKAALKKLYDTIGSELFPTNVDQAKIRLDGPPLSRARPSLLRSLARSLASSIATDNLSSIQLAQRVSSLRAVVELHSTNAWQFAIESFGTHQDSIQDADLGKLVALLAAIPGSWEKCSEPNRQRIRALFSKDKANLSAFPLLLSYGLQVPGLADELTDKIDDLDESNLEIAIGYSARPEYFSKAVNRLREVGGFRRAESFYEMAIVPYEKELTADNLNVLLDAVVHNGQVWDAGLISDHMVRLFRVTQKLLPETSASWAKLLRITSHQRKYEELRNLADKHEIYWKEPDSDASLEVN